MNWEKQFVAWCMAMYYWYSMKLSVGREYVLKARTSADSRSDSMAQFLMRSGTAFLVDLFEDDCASAKKCLEYQLNQVGTRKYQSPWFFVWLNRIQFALYNDNPNEALQLLHKDWANLSKSYVLQGQHYRFIALCLRLCAEIKSLHLQKNKRTTRECLKLAARLSKLHSRAYALYGQGFRLVIQAFNGRLAPEEQWQTVIDGLNRLEHHNFANALSWHRDTNFRPSETPAARQVLLDAGCVAPEKLMNLLLPLAPKQP